MGELISLADHRAARSGEAAGRRGDRTAVLHFDLACPFSYLALERAERLLPGVRWQPTPSAALRRSAPGPGAWAAESARGAAERRARELGLPLVWPAGPSREVAAAMRVAVHAAALGRGGAFALAAGRLAFCGGFELDDPQVLAEAAAAAGLGLDTCLRAAHDRRLDAELDAAARALGRLEAGRLPAVVVGGRVYSGEGALPGAAGALRGKGAGFRRTG